MTISRRSKIVAIAGICTVACLRTVFGGTAEALEVAALRDEVHAKGWIVFAARSEKGDMDIFFCRPDGSAKRNITQTPEFNEGLPQFSRDGAKLLYRRLPRTEQFDNNRHGEQGILVLARSDGSEAAAFGGDGEFPWASWSPDGTQLLCLSPRGFSIVNVASRKVVRTLPRKGFFQQPTWSPDGQWLVGVANSFGTSWSIARRNLASSEATAVNKIDCCTPDWFPDSRNVIFSWRPPQANGQEGRWTQLWRADADGKSRQLVYGEEGRHVYGGHVSPDGKYVLFTGNMQEDGDPKNGGAPMGLMRLRDAPIIGGKNGPVLPLPVGWEPCWTFSAKPAGASKP
jgi:Tol biopolymer transport system component